MPARVPTRCAEAVVAQVAAMTVKEAVRDDIPVQPVDEAAIMKAYDALMAEDPR
jgi:hypothetical protein